MSFAARQKGRAVGGQEFVFAEKAGATRGVTRFQVLPRGRAQVGRQGPQNQLGLSAAEGAPASPSAASIPSVCRVRSLFLWAAFRPLLPLRYWPRRRWVLLAGRCHRGQDRMAAQESLSTKASGSVGSRCSCGCSNGGEQRQQQAAACTIIARNRFSLQRPPKDPKMTPDPDSLKVEMVIVMTFRLSDGSLKVFQTFRPDLKVLSDLV